MGSGSPVPIGAGIEAHIRLPPVYGQKSLDGAGSPPPFDVIQVVLDVGSDIAKDVVAALIATWIVDKRRQRPDGAERRATDETVKVYVGEVKVGPSVEEVANVVRQAIAASPAPIDVPRAVREHNARALGMTLAEYDDLLDR
jgi:hypothetical protein